MSLETILTAALFVALLGALGALSQWFDRENVMTALRMGDGLMSASEIGAASGVSGFRLQAALSTLERQGRLIVGVRIASGAQERVYNIRVAS